MIDLHSHILPGIDDGAKDSALSLQMLQKEVEEGVQTLVFTPHYYGKKRSPEQFIIRRNSAYEKIKESIPDVLNVRLGAEILFTGLNMADNDELSALAIDGTKYILFEFPLSEKWQPILWESLADFIQETDYTPIIAHVERYVETQKKPKLFERLVQMGCLLQVNTTSFLDKGSSSLAFALLKHGLVHCLGSDSHDVETRACDYGKARAQIYEKGYGEAFESIQSNMRSILAGESITPKAGTSLKKFFGIYY